MNRAFAGIAIAVAFASLATAAAGQEDRSFGIGLGLQTGPMLDEEVPVLAAISPQIYFPIAIGETLLLEPSLGVLRVSSSTDFGGDESESSARLIRIGAGLLFLQDLGRSTRGYFGPRVGLVHTSFESSGGGFSDSESRLDWSLAGVAGGEAFLTESFSLGGEVGLEYLRVGDPDEEDEPEGLEQSGSWLRTLAELRIRWYLQ